MPFRVMQPNPFLLLDRTLIFSGSMYHGSPLLLAFLGPMTIKRYRVPALEIGNLCRSSLVKFAVQSLHSCLFFFHNLMPNNRQETIWSYLIKKTMNG